MGDREVLTVQQHNTKIRGTKDPQPHNMSCMDCFFSLHRPDKLPAFRQAIRDHDADALRTLLKPYFGTEVEAEVHYYVHYKAVCELHLDPMTCQIPKPTLCVNCKRAMCWACCNPKVVKAPYKQLFLPGYMCKPCADDYLAAHTPRIELRSGKVYLSQEFQ